MINPHNVHFLPLFRKLRAYHQGTINGLDWVQVFISSNGQPVARYKIGNMEKFINSDGVKEIVVFYADDKPIDSYYIDLRALQQRNGTQIEDSRAKNMTLYYDKDGRQQDCWQNQRLKTFKYHQGN